MEKFKSGDKYKLREIAEILGFSLPTPKNIPTNTRKAIYRELERYCTYHKEGTGKGQIVVIDEVFSTIHDKKDGRTQGNNSKYIDDLKRIILASIEFGSSSLESRKSLYTDCFNIFEEKQYSAMYDDSGDSKAVELYKSTLFSKLKSALDNALKRLERDKKIEYEKQKMIPNALNLGLLSEAIDSGVPFEVILLKDVFFISEDDIKRFPLLELDNVKLIDFIFDKKGDNYFKLIHDNVNQNLDEIEAIQEKYSNQRRQFRQKYLNDHKEDKKYHSESEGEEKLISYIESGIREYFYISPRDSIGKKRKLFKQNLRKVYEFFGSGAYHWDAYKIQLIVDNTEYLTNDKSLSIAHFKEKVSNAMVDYVKNRIKPPRPRYGEFGKKHSIEQDFPDVCELHKRIFRKELIDTTKDR